LRDSSVLGIGGFLLGFGLGYYVFMSLRVSFDIFAWLFIAVGVGIIMIRKLVEGSKR